jgi:WhiB family redox-sensing transcriptional regulator
MAMTGTAAVEVDEHGPGSALRIRPTGRVPAARSAAGAVADLLEDVDSAYARRSDDPRGPQPDPSALVDRSGDDPQASAGTWAEAWAGSSDTFPAGRAADPADRSADEFDDDLDGGDGPEDEAADGDATRIGALLLLAARSREPDPHWKDRALCAETDPEAFFPEKGGSTREAKRVCSSCEVRAECLDFALGNDERFGIWGGLSERERRRLKKRVG